MDYTTLARVKTHLEMEQSDPSRDLFINSLIDPISRAIDTHCRRWFYPRALTRRFDYTSRRRLWVNGDLISVTQLGCNDGTVILDGHYFLYPQIGPPFRWIDISMQYGDVFQWTGSPQQAIAVTGIWGFLHDGETPSLVTAAANTWIAAMLQVGGNMTGVSSTSLGDESKAFSGMLDKIADGPPAEAKFFLSGFIYRDIASGVKNAGQGADYDRGYRRPASEA